MQKLITYFSTLHPLGWFVIAIMCIGWFFMLRELYKGYNLNKEFEKLKKGGES